MPEDLAPDELTVEKAEELLAAPSRRPRARHRPGRPAARSSRRPAATGRTSPRCCPTTRPRRAKPRTGVAVQGRCRSTRSRSTTRCGCCRCRASSASTPRRRRDHRAERPLRPVPEEGHRLALARARGAAVHDHPRRGAGDLRPAQAARPAGPRPPPLRELGADPVDRASRSWSRTAASAPTSPTARPTRRCARTTPSRRSPLERAAELLAEKRAKGPAPKKRRTKAAKKTTAKKTHRQEGDRQEGRRQEGRRREADREDRPRPSGRGGGRADVGRRGVTPDAARVAGSRSTRRTLAPLAGERSGRGADADAVARAMPPDHDVRGGPGDHAVPPALARAGAAPASATGSACSPSPRSRRLPGRRQLRRGRTSRSPACSSCGSRRRSCSARSPARSPTGSTAGWTMVVRRRAAVRAVPVTIPLVGTLWWLLVATLLIESSACSGCRPRTRRCPTWCRASGSRRPTSSASSRPTARRRSRRCVFAGLALLNGLLDNALSRDRRGSTSALYVNAVDASWSPAWRSGGCDLPKPSTASPARASPRVAHRSSRAGSSSAAHRCPRPGRRHARRLRGRRRWSSAWRQHVRRPTSAPATRGYGVLFAAVFLGLAARHVARPAAARRTSPAAGCSGCRYRAPAVWLVLLVAGPEPRRRDRRHPRSGRLRRASPGSPATPCSASRSTTSCAAGPSLRAVAGPGRADLGAGARPGARGAARRLLAAAHRRAQRRRCRSPTTARHGDVPARPGCSRSASASCPTGRWTTAAASRCGADLGGGAHRSGEPVAACAAPARVPGVLRRARGRRRRRQVHPGRAARRPGCESLGHEVVADPRAGRHAGRARSCASAARPPSGPTCAPARPRRCCSPPTGPHHVATVVRPALERGAVVVTDRYVDSSVAYQGAGATWRPTRSRRLSGWATDGLVPDLTVVLDLPAEDAGLRRGCRPGPARVGAAATSTTGCASASSSWPAAAARATSWSTPRGRPSRSRTEVRAAARAAAAASAQQRRRGREAAARPSERAPGGAAEREAAPAARRPRARAAAERAGPPRGREAEERRPASGRRGRRAGRGSAGGRRQAGRRGARPGGAAVAGSRRRQRAARASRPAAGRGTPAERRHQRAAATPEPRRPPPAPRPTRRRRPVDAPTGDPPTRPLSLVDELFGGGDEAHPAATEDRRSSCRGSTSGPTSARLAAPAPRGLGRRGRPGAASSTCCGRRGRRPRRSCAASRRSGMTHAWLFTGPPGSGRSRCGPGVRGRAAVPATAAAASATPATPRWPAPTPTSTVVNTRAALDQASTQARALVSRRRPAPGRRPLAGASSSRTPTGSPSTAGNALLKAIEEPTAAHGLAALRAERSRTCSPTIRAAAGTCRCARRRPTRSPSCWSAATASTRPMAAFAARAAQGHIGRARRLATRRGRPDPAARRRCALPLRARASVGGALLAAGDLVDAATAEADEAADGASATGRARRAASARSAPAPAAGPSRRTCAAQLKDAGERPEDAGPPAPSATSSTGPWSTCRRFYRDVLVLQAGDRRSSWSTRRCATT